MHDLSTFHLHPLSAFCTPLVGAAIRDRSRQVWQQPILYARREKKSFKIAHRGMNPKVGQPPEFPDRSFNQLIYYLYQSLPQVPPIYCFGSIPNISQPCLHRSHTFPKTPTKLSPMPHGFCHRSFRGEKR